MLPKVKKQGYTPDRVGDISKTVERGHFNLVGINSTGCEIWVKVFSR